MSELTGKTLGKYKVLEKIGAGGMGAVYKAMDIELDRTVAVKILPSSFTRDPQYLERFRREAQTAAQLDDPHIINVFDYGEQDGYTYLVMSYIAGQSLGDRLGQPMDTKTTVDIISQVGEGLVFAHNRGVIHRDIKPDNILLTEDGQAIIVDFGLAKIREAARITQTGATLGTGYYMSPEQIKGAKDIDHRTDIYSLGVVLYEMLTGQVPFQADSFWALVKKHVKDPVPSPRSLNPEIPLAVEAVVLKTLEKAPGARYQTVEEFVAALCIATRQPFPDWIKEARVKGPSKVTTVRRREVALGLGKLGLATFGIAMVVCLLSTCGFFAYRGYHRQQAAVHYNRGIVYLSGESWDVALYEFDQVLAIDPTYEDAAEKRAEAQKQLDLKNLLKKADDLCAKADWLTCIEKLEEVRNLDSDYDQVEKKLFDARHNYGQALVEDNQLTRAIEQFDKALEFEPGAAEVQAERDLVAAYLKGMVAYNNDEWENAIDALTEVNDTDANFKDTQDLLYMAYVKCGRELAEAGNMEKGKDYCKKAQDIKPGDSEASGCLKGIEDQQYSAHVAQGNELLDDCQCEEARAEFEQAVGIKSDGIEAQEGLEKYVDLCEKPQLSLITNTKDDYSSTQGHKNWYYVELIGTSWQLMPWDSEDGYYQHGYDPNRGGTAVGRYIKIERVDIHPGKDLPVARKWVSTVSGQIRITGTVRKVDTKCGDGVRVKIMHNSQQLWSKHLPYYDSVGETFTLSATVQQGDSVYFIVDNGASNSPECDRTYFDASIYLASYTCTPTE